MTAAPPAAPQPAARGQARPVADGLFEWPSAEPRLLAGRCLRCGTWVFPSPEACPRCSGEDIEVNPLPRKGRLWTYTVQRFAPKTPYDGPAEFEPYGVGYVEFPGQVLVEGRLTESDPGRLRIGAEVEVCVVPYTKGAAGEDVLTFAFRPVADPDPGDAADRPAPPDDRGDSE